MVVSLLSTTTAVSGAQRPAPADHHFAYPTVRPVVRPVAARVEDSGAW
jgi:hypothetical protein